MEYVSEMLKEIQNELDIASYNCSNIGYTSYADGFYDGLKKAEEILINFQNSIDKK